MIIAVGVQWFPFSRRNRRRDPELYPEGDRPLPWINTGTGGSLTPSQEALMTAASRGRCITLDQSCCCLVGEVSL
jgi:hypothetical protein